MMQQNTSSVGGAVATRFIYHAERFHERMLELDAEGRETDIFAPEGTYVSEEDYQILAAALKTACEVLNEVDPLQHVKPWEPKTFLSGIRLNHPHKR